MVILLLLKASLQVSKGIHCLTNNLNLHIKTEPVTVGADAI